MSIGIFKKERKKQQTIVGVGEGTKKNRTIYQTFERQTF